jgi:hypothetical protein
MAFCPAPGVLGQENVMKIREAVTGKRFRAALAGATIAVFLGVTGLVTAYAQGAPGQISPNPLDAIVAKLDQVLAALNATPATDVLLSTPILLTSCSPMRISRHRRTSVVGSSEYHRRCGRAH